MKPLSRYLRIILLAAIVLAIPASSFAGIFISVGIAPPPLPVYAQPAIPAPGYMWTPGYWAWGPGGYYWVPGTWVQPPTVGLLWTPGYWGWGGGAYIFHAGYWGPHIGFYGGVNYGFGYGGVGYEGGYWNHGVFAYNRSVNNISNVHVTNVYNHTVINNTTVNNVSYNGGTGGIQARPTAQEQSALQENHVQPTAAQVEHVNQAQNNPQLRASENGGKPAIAATSRPADFHSAVPARQAGGEVNTAAYKAAATNGGRLPANMKDPGGNVAANREPNNPAANRSAAPGTNPSNSGHQPAASTYNSERPAQTASRQPAAQPNTEQYHAPAPTNHSEAQPYRAPAESGHSVAQPSHQQPQPAHSQPKPEKEQKEHSQPKHENEPKH